MYSWTMEKHSYSYLADGNDRSSQNKGERTNGPLLHVFKQDQWDLSPDSESPDRWLGF
jgi:hypothetical protein